MCKKKAYIYQMRRVISFSILPFICAPVSHHYLFPLSSFPLPVFSSTVRCFLSLSFSPHTKFLRTFVAKRESAFIDRLQNDLAHISYSS